MSWQRIGENTYIDDTLVTCAEYQLFIDEMREQGKYYQPDHWTSYQFSKGQAREPILGVRFNDAMVFCEWLTGHGANEWAYRLPAIIEAVDPSIELGQVLSHVGYWIKEAENKSKFIKVSSLDYLQEGNKFDFNHILHQYFERASYIVLAKDIDDALIRLFSRPHDIFGDSFNYRTSFSSIGDFRAFARAQSLNLELDRMIDKTIDRSPSNRHGINQIQTIITELVSIVARARQYYLSVQFSNYDKKNNRKKARNLLLDLDSEIARTLDLYLEIITLQERIAGRSPAFEGIRLVKERIR